jgi:subtilisin family serine protease
MDNQDDDPFTPVMKKIIGDGVIPVIAAGNEGPGATTVGSPGWIEDVLTIGAYDPVTGAMADFSSRGPTRDGRVKPDCTAPGVNIDSAIIGMLDNAGDNRRNRFSPISGTSMATPHAFGLIMQMKQCHHETLGAPLTVGEVKDMLISSSSAKSSDSGWGHIHWNKYEEWLRTMYGVA